MKESPKCGICDYSYTILTLGGMRTKSESVLVGLIPTVKSSHHGAKLIPNLLCSGCINYKLLKLETGLVELVSESSELVYRINTVLRNCLHYNLRGENQIESDLAYGVENLYLGLLQVESHIILGRILRIESRCYKQEIRNSQLKQRIEKLLSKKRIREADIINLRSSVENAHKKRRMDQELSKFYLHQKLEFLEKSTSMARGNLLQTLVSVLQVSKSSNTQLRIRQVPVLHIQDILLYDRNTTNLSFQSILIFQQLTSKYLGIKLPFGIKIYSFDNQKQECEFQTMIGREPYWYFAGIPEDHEPSRDTIHYLSKAVSYIVLNFLTLNKQESTWNSDITLYDLFDINSFIWRIIGNRIECLTEESNGEKSLQRSFGLVSKLREPLPEDTESEQCLTENLYHDNKLYLKSFLISIKECGDLPSLNAKVYDFFQHQLKVIDDMTDKYSLKDVSKTANLPRIITKATPGIKVVASLKHNSDEEVSNSPRFHLNSTLEAPTNDFNVSKESDRIAADSNVLKAQDEKWEIVELQ
ncbi:hypothetical protein LJB42_002435 [Komagataella kurtzmanii]|nr:hypothetical protein LJB42_002435 [Komagataella kurtzmanii]